MTISGIPTMYRSVQFRSRLEAKWAAFFDALEWRWEYEPFDCAGWIPDFALIGKEQTTLVEVKPVMDFPAEVADKIDRANRSHEVLIVGLAPFEAKYWSGVSIGWLREQVEIPESEDADGMTFPHWGGCWDESLLIRLTEEYGNGYGFNHTIQTFRDRISGVYAGDHHFVNTYWDREIQPLWASACNRVQWQAKR